MDSKDQLQAIRELIEYGININTCDDNNIPPLHDLLTGENNLNQVDQILAIKLLIDHGADVMMIKNGVPMLTFIFSRANLSEIDLKQIIESLKRQGFDNDRIRYCVEQTHITIHKRSTILSLLN